MKTSHQKWVFEAMKNDQLKRQEHWTQSIAVGDKLFLESVKEGLNSHARGRNIVETETGAYQLREAQEPYGVNDTFAEVGNEYSWDP